MNAKEKYVCGTCKHYVYCYDGNYWTPEDNYCNVTGELKDEQNTCEYWTDLAEPDLTEEERYDGGCMSNFDNENPKEVEDYINGGREIE